jgi:hypothetical protein
MFPPQQDVFPPGTSRPPHGVRDDPTKYGELLVTPITLDRVKEVTQLYGMREELLKEAKSIENKSKVSLAIQANTIAYKENAQKLHEKLHTKYKRQE